MNTHYIVKKYHSLIRTHTHTHTLSLSLSLSVLLLLETVVSSSCDPIKIHRPVRSTGDIVRSNLKKQTIVEITVQIHNPMVISIGLQPMSHTTHLEGKAEETTSQLHQERPHSLMECSPQELKLWKEHTSVQHITHYQ